MTAKEIISDSIKQHVSMCPTSTQELSVLSRSNELIVGTMLPSTKAEEEKSSATSSSTIHIILDKLVQPDIEEKEIGVRKRKSHKIVHLEIGRGGTVKLPNGELVGGLRYSETGWRRIMG